MPTEQQSQFPVAAAEVLGTLAFKEGLPCKPVLDQEVLNLLAGLEVGEGEPILDAWTRNWLLASEAAENELALSEQLRDHCYKYRLEQANLVESHGSGEQRIKEAVALIREVAMQRIFLNLQSNKKPMCSSGSFLWCQQKDSKTSLLLDWVLTTKRKIGPCKSHKA